MGRGDRVAALPTQPLPANVHQLTSNNSSLWRKIVRRYARPFTGFGAFRDSALSFFPIVDWLPRYSWRRQLYGDVMGGLMFAVMNIPQAIAYALLAGLPPVNGLYATFIASVAYPIFASWPHGGPGPFSIIELMSGATADQVMSKYHHSANETLWPIRLHTDVNRETIISTLTFTIGLIYFLCGMVRIQFIAEYFSQPLVSGFITGATFHIFVGQLDQIMGVVKPKATGFGYLFTDLRNLYGLVPKVNQVTLIVAGVSFVTLCVGKFALNPLLERAMPNRRIIIPYELILVIVSTATSALAGLEDNYNVRTIREVPRQMPKPSLPKLFLIPDLLYDAAALAIIQAAIHMSVARMMSQRKGYRVDDNQELYALGGMHMLAGFFPVFPAASGLTTPSFMDECGVTSQLSNLVAAGVVLAVMLAIGPLFHWLPMCVLAVIVIVPLRVLLRGFVEVPGFWRQSRWDFCIWMVTFIATICTDVIGGLGVGIVFELFTIVARTQGPRWNAWYSKQTEHLDICVFHFEAMLLFTNGERFKKAARRVFSRWNTDSRNRSRVFIFDCSSITEVDSVGIRSFAQILKEMRKTECTIYFVKCSDLLLRNLKLTGALPKGRFVFGTVEEAISEARQPRKSISVMESSANNFRQLGRTTPVVSADPVVSGV